MLRSGEYQNGRYNSELIANRLIIDAVLPKIENLAEKVAAVVVNTVDPVVDQFFRDLATHMGQVADLVSQVPEIPGGRPWNPLSLDYLRRKNTTAFWIYTNQINPQVLAVRLGAGRRSKRFKDAQNNSLIPTFNRLSGLKAFGGATVRIQSSDGAEIEGGTKRERYYEKGAGTKRFLRYRYVPITVDALRLKVVVRLWSKFNRSQIPRIESALVANNTINSETARKLIGKRQGGAQRPLVRPYMAYYSTVLIPRLVESALRNKFGMNGSIRVAPP